VTAEIELGHMPTQIISGLLASSWYWKRAGKKKKKNVDVGHHKTAQDAPEPREHRIRSK
jgi:hypothetical protein